MSAATREQAMTKPIDQTRPTITCCNAAFHEITVQGGGADLSFYRCTNCDRQQWTCDGVVVPRDAALELLASSYRKQPAPSGAGEAAAARREARQNAKIVATPTPKTDTELVDLLAGWQILGTPS